MNTESARMLEEQEILTSHSEKERVEEDLPSVSSPAPEITKMTQAEADEVMDSDALLRALRETEASNDVDEPTFFAQKWLIASVFIFLIYLALVFYVK